MIYILFDHNKLLLMTNVTRSELLKLLLSCQKRKEELASGDWKQVVYKAVTVTVDGKGVIQSDLCKPT